MAYEIERKFLVTTEAYKELATSRHSITQAYLARTDRGVVRVRLLDDRGFITLKGRNLGMTRHEWEYAVPAEQVREMIDTLAEGPSIIKTRWLVPWEGHTWEVDEFHGHLQGLCVAEVELCDESEEVSLPPFVGREVTGERRFYNSVLMEERNPTDLLPPKE